ncbi:MAG: LCP family protein [Nitriliruptoraceae bacterium]
MPPTLSTRRSRSVPVRLFAAFGVIAVAVLVVWALLVGVLWGYAWFRLGGVDLRPLDDVEDAAPLGSLGLQAPDGAMTVMVVLTGPVDPTRPVPPDLAAPVALVQAGGPRTDTAVLLLPQELPVTVAGDGQVTIAEVYTETGSEGLLTALLDYTEIRIDHVVTLTIDALPQLVDILGEIELCLPEGCRQADGDTVRDELGDDNSARVARVVAGAVHGVASRLEVRAAVFSPLAARRAVDVVATEIETDVSLRGRELARVAEVLAEPTTLRVDAVPIVRHPTTDAIIPLEEAALVRFQHLRDGTPLTSRDLDEELGALDYSHVDIAVLNGAGIAGLAGRVDEHLTAEGFTTVGTGNAAAFERERSLVSYRGGDPTVELAAIRIAELLDAELEIAATGPQFEGDEVDIVVTAGAHLDDVGVGAQ